jgi:hypothetical protein
LTDLKSTPGVSASDSQSFGMNWAKSICHAALGQNNQHCLSVVRADYHGAASVHTVVATLDPEAPKGYRLTRYIVPEEATSRDDIVVSNEAVTNLTPQEQQALYLFLAVREG